MHTRIYADVVNRAVTIKNDPETNEQPFILCGNDDYKIEFTFDSEWNDKDLKTARFVVVRGRETSHTDVVFTGNVVDVPVMSGVELVYVGIFAGDINATSKAAIKCYKSILCELPYTDPPPPDVYNQILELFKNVKGASVWVRYSSSPDGSDFTEIWHEGQIYMGVATSIYTPMNKEDYVWTRLSQGPKGEKGDPGERGEKSLIGSIETIDGRILTFFVGTHAEYEALPDSVKMANLFAIITDESGRETYEGLIEELVNKSNEHSEAIAGMIAGTLSVGLADVASVAGFADEANTAKAADSLTKLLPISLGGTGANNVLDARGNLGLNHALIFEHGEYTGTGVNKASLSFTHIPVFVIIGQKHAPYSGLSAEDFQAIFVNKLLISDVEKAQERVLTGSRLSSQNVTYVTVDVTWSHNSPPTISWEPAYGEDTTDILNAVGKEYFYFAACFNTTG